MSTDLSARRSDARRNHARVIAAARELFAERGLEVTVPQVAERAGVGKATVYRSYPTKQDLVVAVVGEQFAMLEGRTRAALDGDDAYAEWLAFVPGLFEVLVGDRVLADAFFAGELPQAAGLLELIAELLERAKAGGPVRPDAGPADIRVVLCGAVRQLITLDDRDPASWRRYAELVLNALRARPEEAPPSR